MVSLNGWQNLRNLKYFRDIVIYKLHIILFLYCLNYLGKRSLGGKQLFQLSSSLINHHYALSLGVDLKEFAVHNVRPVLAKL